MGARSSIFSRAWAHAEMVIFVLLCSVALIAVVCKPWGLDPTVAASLAGALFAGSAILLGNWLNRIEGARQQRHKLEKLKTMIAAEMVNVACGLMDAKRLVDAAIIGARAGGQTSPTFDMTPYLPRPMPFTDSTGAELLALEDRAVDAIATFRSGLITTQRAMDEVMAGASLGLSRATTLSDHLGMDMRNLAEAFARIAPARKLQFSSAEPELAAAVLRRAAEPP